MSDEIVNTNLWRWVERRGRPYAGRRSTKKRKDESDCACALCKEMARWWWNPQLQPIRDNEMPECYYCDEHVPDEAVIAYHTLCGL